MTAEQSYAKSKKQARSPSAEPPIYGIYDKYLPGWYMVNGLVFHTASARVAEAQLATMHAMAGPNMDEARFEVLPLGAEPGAATEQEPSVSPV